MSPSAKEWMCKNFPKTIDDLIASPANTVLPEVRVACAKWWYYCHDMLPSGDARAEEKPAQVAHTHYVAVEPRASGSTVNGDEDGASHSPIHEGPTRQVHTDGIQLSSERADEDRSDNHTFRFYMTPIVKRTNRRKYNSHEWFFDGICQGLDTRNSFAFLTDCGTTYCSDCLAKLLYEMRLRNDLIGVTARQRVETPNAFFRPCEESPFSFLRGDHKKTKDPRPCWKCYATYCMSPAPLQGFEFEATLIMNSAMFNMVEALPVMPGPCQLLNWQLMKKFRVVPGYNNLLFHGESDKRVPLLRAPLERMEPVSGTSSDITSFGRSTNDHDDLTHTEFLRVNMRLAEDRILSFVCVFATGFGTKWIPGATFFYRPEITWSVLLTQRRRWLNGTFASFIFYFMSERAQDLIKSGMFDSHKVGKNIRLINALWTLQLAQLVLVLFAPAVFGSASYIALLEMSNKWEWAFGWARYNIFGPVNVAECCIFAYFAVYVLWMILSFRAPKGIISEALCRTLAIAGFFVMLPVYLSVWWTVAQSGLDVVNVLVIGSLGLPVVIALAQSATSARLYLCYLPWFMAYIVFFLVFIPSYSFARLWDTTWGNRDTGDDTAITPGMMTTMKARTMLVISTLGVANCFAAWAFIGVFRLGYEAVLGFMLLVFLPIIIQMVFSFVFLFLVVPMRYIGLRQSTTTDHYKMDQHRRLEEVRTRCVLPIVKVSM